MYRLNVRKDQNLTKALHKLGEFRLINSIPKYNPFTVVPAASFVSKNIVKKKITFATMRKQAAIPALLSPRFRAPHSWVNRSLKSRDLPPFRITKINLKKDFDCYYDVDFSALDFEVRFKVESLISNSYLPNPKNVSLLLAR